MAIISVITWPIDRIVSPGAANHSMAIIGTMSAVQIASQGLRGPI